MGKQRGIALIQVIITTTIILLLTIFYLTVAKRQVASAESIQQRSEAYLSHYSAKNQLLFTLLTEDIQQIRDRGWNFHGVPFKVNQHTTVRLQDLNGLFSLASMTRGEDLQKLLQQFLQPSEATRITASVMDWIDKNDIRRGNGAEQSDYPAGVTVRNDIVQTFTELAFIKGMTLEAEQVLIDNTTFQPTPFFNPMTAPAKLLSALSGKSGVGAALHQIKGKDRTNIRAIESMTGLEQDESINYLIGPGFRITLDSQMEKGYFGKVIEYHVTPYWDHPLAILSQTPKRADTLVKTE